MMNYSLTFGSASLDVGDARLDTQPAGKDFLSLLREFVRDTFASCSLHRRRMQRAGFEPKDFSSLPDMARIPMMSPEAAIGATSAARPARRAG